jgi:hypothetical protein
MRLNGFFFISSLPSHEIWIMRSSELIRVRIPYGYFSMGSVCIGILYLKYGHFVCHIPDQSRHLIHLCFLGFLLGSEVLESSLTFLFSS